MINRIVSQKSYNTHVVGITLLVTQTANSRSTPGEFAVLNHCGKHTFT